METVQFRRAPPPPPPPPPPVPPSLHTVVAPPPPQPPRSRDLVHLPPPLQSRDRELISLSSPRRPHAAKNDYVDSPVAGTNHHHHHTTATVVPQTGTIFNGCGGNNDSSSHSNFIETPPRLPITQQPQPAHKTVIHQQPAKKTQHPSGGTHLFSVDNVAGSTAATGHNASGSGSECKASIYCPHCQKCRCGQCTERRELPRAWLCNNKVECSCQRCVDVTSCLCAVRCVFYHSCANADGDTSVSPSEEPCACCEQPHCCKRWTCMAAMALALPCLCLYWPLQCAHNIITWHYNRCCRRNGCRCHRGRERTKGLLLDSESSSA